jgi:hypothetical protein
MVLKETNIFWQYIHFHQGEKEREREAERKRDIVMKLIPADVANHYYF